MAGAQGRHRHVPPQPGAPNSTALHDCRCSLLVLPATALAAIFDHLDSVDGFSLAQTCHACATEFAHQKAQKIRQELALTISRDPPTGDSPCYGTEMNPVSLHIKWEKNPDSALRRFYAISQRPDCVHFVNALWRQAWPEALWTDMLHDGLSWGWPDAQSNAHHEDDHDEWEICVIVQVQIASDEPLQLS